MFFGNKHTTTELLIMDDCKLHYGWLQVLLSNKINTVHFKEWMTAIRYVTETDTLLQGMYDCN